MAAPPSITISDLLFDIIANEILPKLPSKSLLRFKSVSKSFHNLISSPEFIRLHLRHSLSSYNNRILAVPAVDRTLFTFHLCSLSSVTSNASATFYWRQHDNSVVGFCNGLLLLRGYFRQTRRVLVILNPSTRSYIDVFRTPFHVGFGFDHRTDDYKIVAISDNSGDGSNSRVTKIYSVNSKSWKIVEIIFPTDAIQLPCSGALIDNHLLHWIFWSPLTRTRRIACFDVCLENWMDDVPLPLCYCNSSHEKELLDFGVVDGLLFASFEDQVDMSCNVWVMMKYRVQESWTKLLSVAISDEPKGGVVPIAFRDSSLSQVLVQQRDTSNLFWYNRADGVISEVQVPDFQKRRPYICYDNLVILPGAKRFKHIYELPVDERAWISLV